jgi:hypothetical protein
MSSATIVVAVIVILAGAALVYLEMNSRKNSRAAEQHEKGKTEERVS